MVKGGGGGGGGGGWAVFLGNIETSMDTLCAELDVPVVVIWWEATIAVVTNRSRY